MKIFFNSNLSKCKEVLNMPFFILPNNNNELFSLFISLRYPLFIFFCLPFLLGYPFFNFFMLGIYYNLFSPFFFFFFRLFSYLFLFIKKTIDNFSLHNFTFSVFFFNFFLLLSTFIFAPPCLLFISCTIMWTQPCYRQRV